MIRGGEIDTGFIERHLDELVPESEPDDEIWRGAAAVAWLPDEEEAPLPGLAGFRLNAPRQPGDAGPRRQISDWST
jgi:3-methylcrotonyl-CoA carboxylase alpha subunit